MDIRQVQNEIKAVKLMAKSREMVDFINTATGGDIDSTMTGKEREQFCRHGRIDPALGTFLSSSWAQELVPPALTLITVALALHGAL